MNMCSMVKEGGPFLSITSPFLSYDVTTPRNPINKPTQ